VTRTAALLLCAASIGQCQLHILSGPPGYVPGLFDVRPDGSLHPADAAWKPTPGLRWMTVSFEAGIAVFVSNGVMVRDLITGNLLNSTPVLPGGSPGYTLNRQWLLDTPTRGLVLAIEHTDRAHRTSTLTGWRLDPKSPPAESTFPLDESGIGPAKLLATNALIPTAHWLVP
jgi:hypothetical protein